jgi:hypothetical protein
MRPGITLMLIISLALHGLVALGVGVCHLASGQRLPKPAQSEPTALVLLHDFTMPPAPAPLQEARTTALASLAPVSIHPPVRVTLPVATPNAPAQPLPVVEPNPNAHAKPLPPEQVLNPVPAPPLDGSKGVVFLLDISGSMYESYAGATRLAYARQILAEKVRALPDGTPFAITLYAQRAMSSGPLVAAGVQTRDAAVRFLQHDVDCGGGTNLPEGFLAAESLQPGRVVVVTDGDLNMSAPELMARTRKILGEAGKGPALTVVSIAPRPGTNAERLLEDIADQQGGSYMKAAEGPVALISAGDAPAASAR